MNFKETAAYLINAEEKKTTVPKITIDRHPELTIEEAYKIQHHLVDLKEQKGQRVAGLKMGLTSEAKLKQMNVEDPIYGHVFDYMIMSHGEELDFEEHIHPKVEPEIGFVLEKDLEGPGITGTDVLEATKYVFPAIEVIDSRYENFNFTLPDVIADNTSASKVVFGSDLANPLDIELDLVGVTLAINGRIKSLGAGAAVLGQPAHAIARLANMLAEEGKKVKANVPILSGAITEAITLNPGDYVNARLGGIGEVSFFAV